MFAKSPPCARLVRRYASVSTATAHDLLIVGGGTAGINVANQIKATFEAQDQEAPKMSIIDKAELHHYQPGWTLVGAGLKDLSEVNRPMRDMVPKHVSLVQQFVEKLNPGENSLTTTDGQTHTYKSLVLCPGIKLDYDAVEGLRGAMGQNGVSSIYDYTQVQKVWSNIQDFEKGRAVFSFPGSAPFIKCAGAPIKIMLAAEDYWRREGRRANISVDYMTALPRMFGVVKYSDVLKRLTEERDVSPHFETVLTKVDGVNKVATFKTKEGEVKKEYDFLHATVPMAAHDFIKSSAVANAKGEVAVDEKTLRSTKYDNVWALGDASSLPTSKTAAGIMSQTPVLAHNFFKARQGHQLDAAYDGYTSCPLLTGRGELLLAEFKYGGELAETFSPYGLSQDAPTRWAYHLKKDVLPAIYFGPFARGQWYGRNAFSKPRF
ncbi:FAD/NAD-P-binding domain-containing protein [Protomyces lactucae-debilis]|uniref:Sulfide:quinone oxidoreductase, mitochondrial n=1 Tax=Protomyces lactucae-debilis TaxID=2754530 RepID=A0A1Y2FH83_PROLT|nr:FAD/NAD-P-binding domain-containing protein [Protomyces lactucae-debilis]ORY83300.1 FAD/NAD-P-binding domain-containing protein [Protomyces lactucae-debilis]